jgi:CsoR family transcriptional regulator, copper-sensing transcriptional repressor
MKENNHKQLINQIHRVQGQMTGLEKMIAENKYCVDIIRLSLAIQKSLQSLNQKVLENHLSEHVGHQFKMGQDKKVIKELSEIYYLKNK